MRRDTTRNMSAERYAPQESKRSPLVRREGAGVVVENISAVAWKWVKFECQADPGSNVFIGGTFNQWRPSCFHRLRDKKRDGSYRTLLQIKKGRHEYKFLVNGKWLFNPDLPASAPGKDATLNNMMDVV